MWENVSYLEIRIDSKQVVHNFGIDGVPYLASWYPLNSISSAVFFILFIFVVFTVLLLLLSFLLISNLISKKYDFFIAKFADKKLLCVCFFLHRKETLSWTLNKCRKMFFCNDLFIERNEKKISHFLVIWNLKFKMDERPYFSKRV